MVPWEVDNGEDRSDEEDQGDQEDHCELVDHYEVVVEGRRGHRPSWRS